MSCSIVVFGALLMLAGFFVYALRRRLEETRGELATLQYDHAALVGRVERLEAPGAKPRPEEAPKPAEPEAEAVAVEPPEPAPGVAEETPAAPTAPTALIPPPAEPEPEEEFLRPVELLDEPVEPSEPPRPPIRIDWEQWIGVRGAALLGGIVLALAALLFLKFSIERGLIPPIVRVAFGLLTGIGAIVGSELLRKRDYVATANSLSGAGIVILYASIWAARTLYDLVPVTVAFALMILVTVVCGLLSWRHRSLVIALLGLIGGFATPFLLSTGENRPISLFGYILFLDAGLIALARRRGWPLLVALAMGGTAFYQAAWLFVAMEPHQGLLGLAILAVFALLFVWMGVAGPRADHTWRTTSWAGLFLPFAFAVYFAARADLGVELWQLGLFLAILAGAALWLGRVHEVPLLGTAAAAAIAGVFFVWVVRAWFDTGLPARLAWEAVAVAVALALLFHLVAERFAAGDGVPDSDARKPRPALAELTDPALVAAIGLWPPLILAQLSRAPLWPWLAGWLALVAMLLHQGRRPERGYRRVVAAIGLGLALFLAITELRRDSPSPWLFFGLVVAVAAGFQVLAVLDRRPKARRLNELASAVLPLLLLVGMVADPAHPGFSPRVFLATSILLAFLAVLAATRGGHGWVYPVAVGVLAWGHTAWVDEYFRWKVAPGTELAILCALFGAAALFVFWPFVAGRRFASDRWVLYGSALAAPAWFFALRRVWVGRFGDEAIGALPVLLGLLAMAAAVLARRQLASVPTERQRSLVWFLAVALGFVTLAIPLQLDKEWITIGWALQGLAMILLWKRLDHPGLKYFGLALLATTFVRLILNPAILGYYEKSAWPLFNWLMYTYLVPAAALLLAARTLAPLELERLRSWEGWGGERPVAAQACGLAGLLVIFAWINLTILDYFSTGGYLRLSVDRLPARDLSLSLAWAVYALVLLAIGMARKSVGLRWVSLAFLILTIGKVFLYDLGELKDLYRVASLVGLAISLLLVSLAYQRFVFPARRRAGDDESA